MGVRARVEQNGTRKRGGVYQNRCGGCTTPPVVFWPSLFGFFVLDRTTRTAPAERGRTGAPPFVPLARHGERGVWHQVYPLVSHPPPAVGGVAPVRMYPCGEGSDARQRARADAPTRRVTVDHFIRIVGGGLVRLQRPPSGPAADGRLGDVLDQDAGGATRRGAAARRDSTDADRSRQLSTIKNWAAQRR